MVEKANEKSALVAVVPDVAGVTVTDRPEVQSHETPVASGKKRCTFLGWKPGGVRAENRLKARLEWQVL